MPVNPKDKKFPKDSYSFLALNGPTIENGTCRWSLRKMKFFLFGLMSFVLQILLTSALVCRLEHRNDGGGNRSKGPGLDVILSQIVSLLAYIVFSNVAQLDTLQAIQMYPRSSSSSWWWWWCSAKDGAGGKDPEPTPSGGLPIGGIRVSCILKATQANMVTLAFLAVTFCCENIVEILLNHTAVNFISSLDKLAFTDALSGLFGPDLAGEARRIAGTDLPRGCYRTPDHIRYRALMVFYTLLLSAVAAIILLTENPDSKRVPLHKFVLYGPQYVGYLSVLVVIIHSSVSGLLGSERATTAGPTSTTRPMKNPIGMTVGLSDKNRSVESVDE